MTLLWDGRRIRHTAEEAIDSSIWLRLGSHSQTPREVHLKQRIAECIKVWIG